MSTCKDCSYFFPVSQDAYDYEQGKGDCVNEKEDEKGKYWLSKPIFEDTEQCLVFEQRK
jgi:benzylsuccinate synthase/naphthyl-2-methylsuccinate synthase gamma subunit